MDPKGLDEPGQSEQPSDRLVDCWYRQVSTDLADKNVRDLAMAGYGFHGSRVRIHPERERARPSRFKKQPCLRR